MFLFSNSVRASSTTIRGVRYNVFSCYGGSELIYDRIGRIIEDSFVNADAVEITNPSLVDNDIALGDEEWYADTVIKSLRERSN